MYEVLEVNFTSLMRHRLKTQIVGHEFPSQFRYTGTSSAHQEYHTLPLRSNWKEIGIIFNEAYENI
jgi:hypothetical protein